MVVVTRRRELPQAPSEFEIGDVVTVWIAGNRRTRAKVISVQGHGGRWVYGLVGKAGKVLRDGHSTLFEERKLSFHGRGDDEIDVQKVAAPTPKQKSPGPFPDPPVDVDNSERTYNTAESRKASSDKTFFESPHQTLPGASRIPPSVDFAGLDRVSNTEELRGGVSHNVSSEFFSTLDNPSHDVGDQMKKASDKELDSIISMIAQPRPGKQELRSDPNQRPSQELPSQQIVKELLTHESQQQLVSESSNPASGPENASTPSGTVLSRSEIQTPFSSTIGLDDMQLPSTPPSFAGPHAGRLEAPPAPTASSIRPYLGRFEDDNISVVSSVFSVKSLASSATDISKGSGYSAEQIATATRELVLIFQEDEALVPLYKAAIESLAIGPYRLQRNLRRLLKSYAEHLKDEANDSLEYLASRLVLLKSRFLAESIVQKFNVSTVHRTVQEVQEVEEGSSDNEEKGTVSDNNFQDLVALREFLVRSNAFSILRAQVQQFVMPQTLKVSDKQATLAGESRAEKDIKSQHNTLHNFHRVLFKLKQCIGWLLVVTGCIEPSLAPGMHRLRWECRCGETFFGDLIELREGGIAELTSRMEQSSKVKILSKSNPTSNSGQRYNFQFPGRWLQSTIRKIRSSLRSFSKQSTLPQHNRSNANTTCPLPSNTQANQQTLHMMACIHKGKLKRTLCQDPIDNIKTDRQLFVFLAKQYAQHRGRFRTIISLKTIEGIFFVKFRLRMGGSVEIRHHNPCCTSTNTDCSCIPPAPKVEPSPHAEYRCIPGPPSTYPPVLPNFLMHLVKSPCEIDENGTEILDLLPKRICGELKCKIGQPAEGWGIYYKEEWDKDMIVLCVFVVFALGSLLFGVLWSKFEMDIQGAFGVSAYMGTAASILVAMIAMRADK